MPLSPALACILHLVGDFRYSHYPYPSTFNNLLLYMHYELYDIYHVITLVENEKAVDMQHKEQSNKESVQNPIYAGRGN